MQRGTCRHGLSTKSPYYIPDFRRYELIYFCLQYPEWKKYLKDYKLRKGTEEFDDPTGDEATERALREGKMKLVEKVAYEAGGDVYGKYILKAVTEDLSFNNLKYYHGIPCGRNMYYEMWHKFFYLLSQEKHTF